MTPQECIELLVNKVGHERQCDCGSETFDGSYGPLYQIAYLIGGLRYAMHKELVDSGR